MNDDSYSPPKKSSLKMPKFDGTFAEGWIFLAKRYFLFNRTHEDQKLVIEFFHMEGIALKWFLWIEASDFLTF